MSQLLIQHYLNDLQTLRRVLRHVARVGGARGVQDAAQGLGQVARSDLHSRIRVLTRCKDPRLSDGALLHELRVPLGYWEAKDEDDDLDDEIEKKFRKGYPQDNIIFDDSREAVLIQNKQEVMRCGDRGPGATAKSCWTCSSATSVAEIADFRKAVEQFKTDLPDGAQSAARDDRAARRRDNADSARRRSSSSSTPRTRSTRTSPPPTCARC